MNTEADKKFTLKLPSKPSYLISLALNDLKKAVKEGCIVDMDAMYAVDTIGIPRVDRYGVLTMDYRQCCFVSISGAVMRRAVLNNKTVRLVDFSEQVIPKLESLHSFSRGEVKDGLEWLEISISKALEAGIPMFFEVVRYERNPLRFFRDMKCLAKLLSKAGY